MEFPTSSAVYMNIRKKNIDYYSETKWDDDVFTNIAVFKPLFFTHI